MASNIKKRFTVSLDIDVKTAEQQVKSTVGNIKKILSDLGSASDKMGYFKELVDYISQVDTALSALKAKNAGTFDGLFDGLDADLRKVMESIFNTSKESMSALDGLRQKISDASTNGAGVKELRQIAEEINSLFVGLGAIPPIDLDKQFTGRGKTADRVKVLSDALDNFALVWDNVHNKIKGGFGFEGTGGAGGVEQFTSNVQDELDKLEEQLTRLKKLQQDIVKTLSDVGQYNNKGSIFAKGAKFSQQDVVDTVRAFNAAQKAFQQFKGDKGSIEYNEITSQYLQQAAKFASMYSELKNLGTENNALFRKIENIVPKGSKSTLGAMMKKLSINADDALMGDLENSLINFQKNLDVQINNITNKMQQLGVNNKAAASSYDILSKKVKEYVSIQKKIDSGLDVDNDGLDLEEKIRKLDEYFLALDKAGTKEKEIAKVLEDLSFGDINEANALEQLCNILQVKIPTAAKVAEDSLKKVKDAVSGEGDAGTGTGTGTGGTITNIDFTDLKNTIQSEAAALANKLDSVLKVELVKDDTNIQGAIDGVRSIVEKISGAIDSYNSLKETSAKQAEVEVMKNNLSQLLNFITQHNNSNKTEQELKAILMSDKTISIGYGEDGHVTADTKLQTALSNLTSSIIADIHSHPVSWNGSMSYMNDMFSGSNGDLGGTRFAKKIGAQITSMITGNIMRTLDLTKLTPSQLSRFVSELSDTEKRYMKDPAYSQYVGSSNGELRRYRSPSLEHAHKTTEVFEQMMYDSFKAIGISKDKVDSDIFHKFNLADNVQLTQAATYLVDMANSAHQAISPLERLKDILSSLGSDVDSDIAKTKFTAFNKGEISAADVFNSLNTYGLKVNQDTIDSMLKIDTAGELSSVDSLLTNISSILNVISSSVSHIESNTAKSTSDKFDMAMNDIIDLGNGINNGRLTAGVKSIFDPLNVSEYKSKETLQQADESVLVFKDLLQDVYRKSMEDGEVPVDALELTLDKFKIALSHISDAIKQVNLYESRTGESVYDGSEYATNLLSEKYSEVVDPTNLQALLYMLSQAKLDISKFKGEHDGGLHGSVDEDVSDIGLVVGGLQQIQSTLESIYGVLHGFTGIEADTKNAVKYSKPIDETAATARSLSDQDLSVLNSILQSVQDINAYLHTDNVDEVTEKPDDNNQEQVEQSSIYQLLASKLPGTVASDDTLSSVRDLLSQLVAAATAQDKDAQEEKDSKEQESFGQLVTTLTSAVDSLQKVASGIIEHQQAQKTDTRSAMAKISDPTKYKQISDIAAGSVGDLGSEVKIKSLRALADGVVQVEGAFKNAENMWEGFTVRVNESNEAVDLAVNKQSAFAKSLNTTAAAVKQTQNAFKDENKKLTGMFNTLDFKADSTALDSEQQKIADEYRDLTNVLRQYSQSASQVSQSEINNTMQRVAALQQEINAYKTKYNINNAHGGAKNAPGATDVSREQKRFRELNIRSKQYVDSGSVVVDDSLKKYQGALEELIALQNTFRSGQTLTSDQLEQFDILRLKCKYAGDELKKILDASNKFKTTGLNIKPIEGWDQLEDFERADVLKNYVRETYGASARIKELDANAGTLTFTLKGADGAIETMTVSLNAAKTALATTSNGTKHASSLFGDLWNKFKGLGKYAMARFGVDEIFRAIRSGIQDVREIDSALTELKKVTNETDGAYDRFLQNMSKIAGVVGSTVSELTTMASEWARLGYSMQESAMLAENTAILLNVSEFESATEASEALISTMQAFQYTADESGHVVDILNEVGNNYAVSSDGIATALKTSASALMEGGNNLEQATALVAAANKVVQDPASVGSALRTISLRLRGTSVEILEEMGEETDGVVESTSKLQDKLKALTGVDILTDAGAYKDTYTILKEIGTVWQDLSSIDQAAALELMAGKNRANTLAAILNNMQDLEGAYESAMQANGSAIRENETYLNSIQGRIDLFNNAVQTMWMNFMNDDVVKWIVDLGTSIVKLVDTIGLIPAALGGFAGYRLVVKSIKSDFADMGKTIRKTINIDDITDDASQSVKNLKDGIDDATESTKKQTDATKEKTQAQRENNNEQTKDNALDTTDNAIDDVSDDIDRKKAQATREKTQAQRENNNEQVKDNVLDQMGNNQNATSGILGSIKTIGSSFGGTLLKVAGTALKGLAIGALVSVVTSLAGKFLGWLNDEVIHGTEKAIGRADDALNKYTERQEELNDQKSTVDELSEAYARLSSGVNTLTNENIGLTTEAHQEYLDVVNDIAAMFPTLISGYDAQGNAIINLKGNVDGLTDSYQRMREEAALEFLTDKNKEDTWTKYKNKSITGTWFDKDDVAYDFTAKDQKDVLEAISSMSEKDLRAFYYADKHGMDDQFDILAKYLPDMDRDMMYATTIQTLNKSTKSEEYDSLDSYKNYVNRTLSEVNQTVTDSMRGIREIISADLIFNSAYQDLDTASQGIVKTIINNMDPSMIAESGAKNADDFISWFSSEVIAKVGKNSDLYASLSDVSNNISKAIINKDGVAFADAQAEWDKLVEGMQRDASGNIKIDLDADVVTQYLQKFVKEAEDQSKNFEVQLQMQADFESEDIIKNIAESTGKELPAFFKWDFTAKDAYQEIANNLAGDDGILRTDELQDAYDKYLSGAFEGNYKENRSLELFNAFVEYYCTDADTLIAKMMELGYVAESLADIPSFSLASEATNEDVDKFQETIDSIKSAWESLNSGEMTKSEFIDLAQEFPELMKGIDFTAGDWMIQAKQNLESLNTTTIDDFIAELQKAKEAMLARGEDEANIAIVDSFIAYAEQQREQLKHSDAVMKTHADTVSGLTEAYENYKNILTETDEILYDGQKVSENYYESLKEFIGDTEELSACFDENNRQIVTNAEGLRELISEQEKAIVQNVQIAKAQSQLQYHDLVQQLDESVEYYFTLDEAGKAATDMLIDQIGTVKRSINQYQLLEDSLLGTTSAFEKFTQAQELDAKNTYGEQYVDMVQTMYDAMTDTSQLGTPQFWAATDALVPDEIYSNLDSSYEKIQAIYQYFNSNILPTLTLDDKQFSIGYDAIENFVEKAQEVGVFSGTDVTSFGLSSKFLYELEDGEDALKAFADQMGMTTTQVYAMLSEMDRYNAEGIGLSMLLQLDNSTAGQLTYVTNELEQLYIQRKKLYDQQTAGADVEGLLNQNWADIAAAEARMAGIEKQMSDIASAYIEVGSAIDNISGDSDITVEDLKKEVPKELYTTLKLDGVESVSEALKILTDYKLQLEEPTTMDLVFEKGEIEDAIKAIENEDATISAKLQVSDDGFYEVKDEYVDELETDINLQSYLELKNEQVFVSDALSSALSVSEQYLSQIAANTSIMAGTDNIDNADKTDDGDNTANDQNNVFGESKPWPDVFTTETRTNINSFMQSVMKKMVSLNKSPMNFKQQNDFDNLGQIYKQAEALRNGIDDATMLAENATAELSKLQKEASKYDVRAPITPKEISIEPEGDVVVTGAQGDPVAPDWLTPGTSAYKLAGDAVLGRSNDGSDVMMPQYGQPYIDPATATQEIQADNVWFDAANVNTIESDNSNVDTVTESSGSSQIDMPDTGNLQETTQQVGELADATQDARSEAEALYQVYASNDEKLALLKDIEDKSHILTQDEALAFEIQIDENSVLTVQDVINKLLAEQDRLKQSSLFDAEWFKVEGVKTYSELQSEVSSFNEIIDQTDEIVGDNIEITQAYKNSLLGLCESQDEIDELNACFDTNNDLVVKNAKGIKKLVAEKKKELASDTKLARAQSELEYYSLVRQLDTTIDGINNLDGATNGTIDSILSQIDVVRQAIYQYQLLEAQLLGTTNAFKEYQDAQNVDSQNTYDDEYVSMAQTMYDAFYKTGEVGTEANWAAIEALVPDEVYQGLTSDMDKMKAIYDYFNKNILPTLTLEDDQLSLGYENIEGFVKKGIGAGVFEGNIEEFNLVEGMNLEKAAELMGMTEAQAYALFATLDKYNISRGEQSFLGQLDDSTAGDIMEVTTEIEELNKQKAALLEDGGYEQNKTAIDEINQKLAESEGKLQTLGAQSYQTWQEYTQNDAALQALGSVEDKTQLLTAEMAKQLGINFDENSGKTVQQVYDELLAKKLALETPTVLTAQLAIENIDTQIETLEQALESGDYTNVDPVSVGLEVGDAPTKADVEAKLAALKEDKAVIATTFGIELSEEEKAGIQEQLNAIEQFKINDKTFTVTGNTSATMIALKSVQDYVINDKEYTVTEVKRTINSSSSSNTSPVNGTAHVGGTAYAGGYWGAPETDNKSLVGELGPEILVRNGRWQTIGENGAEFTEVKKGDIIFNHKQTRELLNNGYVTGRGKAYVEGNAYSGLWKPTNGSGSSSSSSSNNSKNAKTASKSSKELSNDFKEIFDWIEVRLEEITEAIDLSTAKLDNAIGYVKQNKLIDEIIGLNQDLHDNLIAGAKEYYAFSEELLKKVPEKYREMAQDGSIAIESFTGKVGDKTLDAIKDYREWVQKGADATQQAEETLAEISSLAKQAIDNIAADYENKKSMRDNKIDQLDAYNALLETDIGFESAKIYQAMMNENNKIISTLNEQRSAMQSELNKRVESGEIKKYSQDWYDAVNDIAALDTEIIELKTDVEDFQDSINELHWDQFDLLITQIEAITEEAENLIDILSNSDLVDKETAEWTDAGVTSLGLYAQQMEAAEIQAKQYQEEIKYLNKNWKVLGYTEAEYIDKLEELKSGQYDSIKLYHDMRDAIKDLTSERVDAIKEGIEKEIEAYEELINKKKEELDSEKDLYDFQKGVANQQKEIADIERKLAALSADNSASARAQRAKLQAELAEAQQELQDTYYDRSISDQQEALDKELENFQEEKNKEIEGWEEYLEDTNKVVSDSLAVVQSNTGAVYQTLKEMGEEYSLSISESLTSPWQEGENAIQSFSETFGISMSQTVEELKELELEFAATMLEIEQSGKQAVDTVQTNASNYQVSDYQKPKKSGSFSGDSVHPYGKISESTSNIKKGSKGDAVKALQYALNELGYSNNGTSKVDGIFGTDTQKALKKFQKAMGITADGVVGKKTREKFKLKGYAVGTTGVKNDQLALIDELGEELVMHAGRGGKLMFMSKGSTVVPHDLTENLMQLGELNPQDVLDRSRPVISAPRITNNNIEVNMEFGEIVHIDTVTNETIPNLTKAIEKQMDKYMKNINNNIRKYTR